MSKKHLAIDLFERDKGDLKRTKFTNLKNNDLDLPDFPSQYKRNLSSLIMSKFDPNIKQKQKVPNTFEPATKKEEYSKKKSILKNPFPNESYGGKSPFFTETEIEVDHFVNEQNPTKKVIFKTKFNLNEENEKNHVKGANNFFSKKKMIENLLMCSQKISPKNLNLESFFKFEFFNAVQTECLTSLIFENHNMVISAPTGSGKTILFELAILRKGFNDNSMDFFSNFTNNLNNQKIIYIAPIKALCQERKNDWENKFSNLKVLFLFKNIFYPLDFYKRNIKFFLFNFFLKRN